MRTDHRHYHFHLTRMYAILNLIQTRARVTEHCYRNSTVTQKENALECMSPVHHIVVIQQFSFNSISTLHLHGLFLTVLLVSFPHINIVLQFPVSLPEFSHYLSKTGPNSNKCSVVCFVTLRKLIAYNCKLSFTFLGPSKI
jgi:hypothetical protein